MARPLQIVATIPVLPAMVLDTNVPEDPAPAWAAGTVYALGDRVRVDSTHKVYESIAAVVAGTCTISNASPAVVSWPAHARQNGEAVRFTTTGTLPSPLAVGTVYFVVNRTVDTFQVAATSGGAAIATTSAGSGVHSCEGYLNKGRDPTDPTSLATYWQEVGSTNRYKLFDLVKVGATVQGPTIWYKLQPGDNIPTLFVGRIKEGHSVRARLMDPTGTTMLWDSTPIDIGPQPAAPDWWEFSFGDWTAAMKSQLLIENIPQNLTAQLWVDIEGTDALEVGKLRFGIGHLFGEGVLDGVDISGKVYRATERDDFGALQLRQGTTVKTLDIEVPLRREEVDRLDLFLEGREGKTSVFVASTHYERTVIDGICTGYRIKGHNNRGLAVMKLESV